MRNQYKTYRKALHPKLGHESSKHARRQTLDLNWMGAILWFSVSTTHKDPFLKGQFNEPKKPNLFQFNINIVRDFSQDKVKAAAVPCLMFTMIEHFAFIGWLSVGRWE